MQVVREEWSFVCLLTTDAEIFVEVILLQSGVAIVVIFIIKFLIISLAY